MGLGRLYGGLITTTDHNDNIIKCTKRVFGLCDDAKDLAIEDLKDSMRRHVKDFKETNWIYTARKYGANFSDVIGEFPEEVYFYCKAIPIKNNSEVTIK